jgi:hypothetical protein
MEAGVSDWEDWQVRQASLKGPSEVRAGIVEAVIYIGLQGAGKSTFCRERLFHTHVRLSLDMLKTRHR